MRILHTSDWHLGRSFHREGMLGHQAAYVDHLLAVVASEQVDLVVVSGDVYDRALPPVDAVRLANETFTRLSRSRAEVVVTSGNHDSAQRLGFGSELIDAAGVFIRTRAESVGTPVLLGDEHGDVAVYGVPYLDPDAMRSAWRLSGALSRVRAHRGDAQDPHRSRGSRRSFGGARTRLRGRRPRPATPNVTSASVASRSSPPACSKASTTRRWDTCTAGRP